MKVLEVKHVEGVATWYEGQMQYCAVLANAVTSEEIRLILDWEDARQLVTSTLTQLAVSANDVGAQKMIELFVQAAREIEERDNQ